MISGVLEQDFEAWQAVYLLCVSLTVPMLSAGLTFSAGRENREVGVMESLLSLIGFGLIVPQWGGVLIFFLMAIVLPALGAPVGAVAVVAICLATSWTLAIRSVVGV